MKAAIVFLAALVLLAAPATAGVTPAKLFVYESEELGRFVGQIVNDPAAMNGRAVHCSPARPTSGWAQYGPGTTDQDAGPYLARFRLKVSDNSSGDVVATVDAFHDGVPGRVVRREVRGTDFRSSDAYEYMDLRLERIAAGKMEYRVYWQGKAELWLDRVELIRVSPGETEWLGVRLPEYLEERIAQLDLSLSLPALADLSCRVSTSSEGGDPISEHYTVNPGQGGARLAVPRPAVAAKSVRVEVEILSGKDTICRLRETVPVFTRRAAEENFAKIDARELRAYFGRRREVLVERIGSLARRAKEPLSSEHLLANATINTEFTVD